MGDSNGLLRGKRGLILGLANNHSIAWGIAKAAHKAGAELAFTYQGEALKKRVVPLAEEVGGFVCGHCDVTNHSIAWGIAKAAHKAGAELAFTYQGEALKKRVVPLAEEVGGFVCGHCDVTDAASIDAAFDAVKQKWGKIDFLVHAIGFSDKDELTGRYVDTSEANFNMTMNISVYSLTAVTQRAEKLMPDGGSILTLTYYGSEKVMPNYNVMGVAKAALEASVKYLAVDLGPKKIRVNAVSAGPIDIDLLWLG